MKPLTLFQAVILLVGVVVPGLKGSHHARQLLVDLLQYYNTMEIPIAEHRDPIIVSVDVSVQKIIKLDVDAGELTSMVWLTLSWKDYHLSWDPHRYNGLKAIRLPTAKIWQPDLRFYNSVSQNIETTLAAVSSRGEVVVVTPIVVTTRCGAARDSRRWFPFDVHSCALVVGSWTFGKNRLDLHNATSTTTVRHGSGTSIEVNFAISAASSGHRPQSTYTSSALNRVEDIENGEWQLLDAHSSRHETVHPCCGDEAYTSIQVALRLRRKPMRHLLSLHLPLLWLLLLACATFLVPHERSDLRLMTGALLMMGVFWWPSGQHLPWSMSAGHVYAAFIVLGVSTCIVSHCLQLSLLPTTNGRRKTAITEHLNRVLTIPLVVKLTGVSNNRPEHDKEELPDCSRVLDRLSLLFTAALTCLALLTCWILPWLCV